jgi:hypothetical protein
MEWLESHPPTRVDFSTFFGHTTPAAVLSTLTYPPTTVKNRLAAQSLGYAGLSTSQDRQLTSRGPSEWRNRLCAWTSSVEGDDRHRAGHLAPKPATDLLRGLRRSCVPANCSPYDFGLQRRSKTVNRHTDHIPRQSGLDYAPWERWRHEIALRVSFHQQRVQTSQPYKPVQKSCSAAASKP